MTENQKARKGQVIRVENKKRVTRAKEAYLGVWLEDYNGDQDTCVLFTEYELDPVQVVSVQGLDMVPGRLYPVHQGKRCFFLVRLFVGEQDVCYKLPDTRLKRALLRSERNPEDHLQKTLYYKIFG